VEPVSVVYGNKPADRAGSLSRQDDAGVVAAIRQFNQFPEGRIAW